MTEVKGTMNYVLQIDPSGEKHGMSYDNNMQNDIACLMVAAQVMTIHLQAQKDYKKNSKNPSDRKAIAKNISLIADGLRGLKPLMNSLLNTYDDYQEYLTKQSVSDSSGIEGVVEPPKQS